MVWVVQWSRFQRLRTGITWLPVLRAASRVSGRASENRCPVTQINKVNGVLVDYPLRLSDPRPAWGVAPDLICQPPALCQV